MSAAYGRPSRAADDAAMAAIESMRADDRRFEAQDCYGDVVRRHQGRALRIAHRMLRDPADAEEVVQDAFVKAYVHLASFRRELPFEVWFTRILTNSCRDRIRMRSRRERRVVSAPQREFERREFWNSVPAVTRSPEDQVLAQERFRVLARALIQLPARQRAVITLSHFKGLTAPEVSALTGWNTSTIRVQLFRGLRSLRTLLNVGESQGTGATPMAAA